MFENGHAVIKTSIPLEDIDAGSLATYPMQTWFWDVKVWEAAIKQGGRQEYKSVQEPGNEENISFISHLLQQCVYRLFENNLLDAKRFCSFETLVIAETERKQIWEIPGKGSVAEKEDLYHLANPEEFASVFSMDRWYAFWEKAHQHFVGIDFIKGQYCRLIITTEAARIHNSHKKDGRIYAAIDLKSFYASVECHERMLDPLETNLVVADLSRTEKTICLAVSPSLKAYGISGRARLFEVVQRVKEVNTERLYKAPHRKFTAASYDKRELENHPEYKLEYIVAPPRMSLYVEYSTRIYNVYLKYIAPEDIHVYSIDEVMIDLTSYLDIYHVSPEQLVKKMVQDIYVNTGITATAGIGTNLYLCKVAMDIVAKHVEPDEDGVRIAKLDEISYRKLLWSHTPITDFWRVGRGYAKKLAQYGLYTMGDIARCSLEDERSYHNEDLLYRLFGINAELLIDHAWGWEPCTIADVKGYRPETKSICSGQVLHCPYEAQKARIVMREMADALSLELVSKGLVTDQLVVTIGYKKRNRVELQFCFHTVF